MTQTASARLRKWGSLATAAVAILAFGHYAVPPFAQLLGLATTQEVQALQHHVERSDSAHTQDSAALHTELHDIQRSIERLGCGVAPEMFEDCRQLRRASASRR